MRTRLLEGLRRYSLGSTIYPEERAALQQIITFVEQVPAAFEREHLSGHMTAGAFVLEQDLSRVLLTHHLKLDKWLHLGGHADGDEDLSRVALREAEEESGIEGLSLVSDDIFDVDIHEIPQHGDTAAHLHYDVRFLVYAPSRAPFKVSHESHDLAWLTPSEVLEKTDEASMLRMVRKWDGLRHCASLDTQIRITQDQSISL